MQHALHDPVGQTVLAGSVNAMWKACKLIAALPFDGLRASHASAVRAGFVENSMLESRNFEQALAAIEGAVLGPLARRV
jgi:hypothetical protein